MFNRLFKKREARKDAVNKAREGFTSWLEISKSNGWKLYQEKIDKAVSIIENKMKDDTLLTGEDLKRLQLALKVWEQVRRIPKEIEDNAKGGIK